MLVDHSQIVIHKELETHYHAGVPSPTERNGRKGKESPTKKNVETLDVGSIPSEGKIVSIIRWRRHEEGQLSDPQKGT